MQAVILAAGMGKRLKELTRKKTKCMIEVNGVTLIERMLSQLEKLGLSRIIIVIGHEGKGLTDFVLSLSINTPIQFVINEVYYRTNNIFSLYLAKEYLITEDTLLLESDLIIEDSVLQKIVADPYPNLALVSKYESWMDGTVVKIDSNGTIQSFLDKKHFEYEDIRNYYKTVNIYKFSKAFSASHYVPFLEAYIKALGNNEYYEQVLRVITLLDEPGIRALALDNEKWYEIDDIQDLNIAESIFTSLESDKLSKFQERYGGYWRYPTLLDFCYLVNPYYPPQRLLDEMKANFERLLSDYPSGIEINNLLAAKYFGIKEEYILVGNGAAELIRSLMNYSSGKIGIMMPTFEEYFNRKYKNEVVSFKPDNQDFSYTIDDLIEFYGNHEIKNLVLVNPDNPSGNYIEKSNVLKLAEWARNSSINLIVDESFVDFIEVENGGSLLEDRILEEYTNIIVVKSISKSYGVPGLRLGLLASSNQEVILTLKKDVSIWNINSFAEFFLQIFEKYHSEYINALKEVRNTRKLFLDDLKEIPSLRAVPSQANYILCEVRNTKITSRRLAEILLSDFEILIKDLSNKRGVCGRNYIRLSVRTKKENDKLLNALKRVFSEEPGIPQDDEK